MTPPVTVWPYSAVFWLVFVWAYWPEFAVISRSRGMAGPQDTGSRRIITLGSSAATFAAFALAYGLPRAALPARHAVFWAGVATMIVVYGYRVAVEERALVATLGDAYREYMRRTKRFIPFVV